MILKEKIKNFSKKEKIIGGLFLSIIILGSIWMFLYNNGQNLNKNLDKKITEVKNKIKEYNKEDDKKLLNYLDKNKGKIVEIDGLKVYISPDFNGKSLENFPKVKENLDKLLNKLKELGLNNKNTNFIIRSTGDLPGPFLSVQVTDKERGKTIKKFEEEANKKIEKLNKYNKQIANSIKERFKNERIIIGNNDFNGYCISNTSLGIKKGTSVQVCPDKASLLKMVGKNKFILQGTNKVITLANMPDYVNKDVTETDNGFKKIYNYNAYLLYFPYVIDKQIKDIMISNLMSYYKDIFWLNKTLYSEDGLVLINIIKGISNLLILKSENKVDDKKINKIIDDFYNLYVKEFNKLNSNDKNNNLINKLRNKPISKDEFEKKFIKMYKILSKYITTPLETIDFVNLLNLEKLTPDNVHNKIMSIDTFIQELEFKHLLNNKELLKQINSILPTEYVRDKKGNKKALSKIGKDKVILWFYTDVLNMIPNLAIDLYPEDKRLVKLYVDSGLNQAKFAPIISIGFIQNDINLKDTFHPFIYSLENGGIIIEPKDSKVLDFTKFWQLGKEGKIKDINKLAQEKNKRLFEPNNTCKKINEIDKEYGFKSFVINYKCNINSFVLDKLSKEMSKFNNRVSQMFSFINRGNGITEWLSPEKYYILLRLYPDVLYWRFDKPEKREKFFKDFKEAINYLNNSTDKKEGLAGFKRIMSKYYKYFDDVDDYIHLRGNINNLNIVIYGQA